MPARNQPIPADRLRKYLAEGMTVKAICERTGRSDQAVYSAIRENGLTINRVMSRPLTTDEAIATLPLFAAARRTDPPTSHYAANRARVAGHCLRILDSLGQGPAGQTEIASRTGLTVAAVSKRLTQLRRAGLVERTGREVAAGEAEYRNTSRQSR
jgi:hypothetical protein